MTSGHHVTDAQRWRILQLLAIGQGPRQIARRLELHRTTVAVVIREAAVAWYGQHVASERIDELRDRE